MKTFFIISMVLVGSQAFFVPLPEKNSPPLVRNPRNPQQPQEDFRPRFPRSIQNFEKLAIRPAHHHEISEDKFQEMKLRWEAMTPEERIEHINQRKPYLNHQREAHREEIGGKNKFDEMRQRWESMTPEERDEVKNGRRKHQQEREVAQNERRIHNQERKVAQNEKRKHQEERKQAQNDQPIFQGFVPL